MYFKSENEKVSAVKVKKTKKDIIRRKINCIKSEESVLRKESSCGKDL